MQPLHSYPDADTLDVWARNAGPDRASRAWAWKSISDAGGRLAFGSDWPVVTLNPWEGVQTAVTRQTTEGLPEGVDSRFRYVLLVSKRAEQLIQGSMPKIKSRHAKPTRVAMEEIDRNQVKWQLAPPVEEPTALENE